MESWLWRRKWTNIAAACASDRIGFEKLKYINLHLLAVANRNGFTNRPGDIPPGLADYHVCIVIMQIEAQYLSAHYSPQAPDPACDSRATECPCPQFPQRQVPPPTSDLRNARQNTRRYHRTHPATTRAARAAGGLGAGTTRGRAGEARLEAHQPSPASAVQS